MTSKQEGLYRIREAYEISESMKRLGMDLAGLKVALVCYFAWEKLGTSYEEQFSNTNQTESETTP